MEGSVIRLDKAPDNYNFFKKIRIMLSIKNTATTVRKIKFSNLLRVYFSVFYGGLNKTKYDILAHGLHINYSNIKCVWLGNTTILTNLLYHRDDTLTQN